MLGIINTVQKMKFSIKDFFITCDQIRRKLWIRSHLQKRLSMKNFSFSPVKISRLAFCYENTCSKISQTRAKLSSEILMFFRKDMSISRYAQLFLSQRNVGVFYFDKVFFLITFPLFPQTLASFWSLVYIHNEKRHTNK